MPIDADGRPDVRIPHMTIDGNTLNYYNEDGELIWRVDDIGAYTTRSTSSATYPLRNYRINIDDLSFVGERKISEDEGQSDIKDEQGGSLDEFLESFWRY